MAAPSLIKTGWHLPPDPSGSITAALHDVGEFEVLAFSWGLSSSSSGGAGGGGPRGAPDVQDVSLTKYINELSPEIFVAIAAGKYIPEASLTYADKAGKPILRLLMHDILVTSLSLGGSSGEDEPTENVTVNFTKLVFEYKEPSSGWDFDTNTQA